ncbi:MAG TPA: hypothetical protein VJR89_37290 [Polyangiales bacterium]|nr:hypothetical protein [Polyangiales bacterium]
MAGCSALIGVDDKQCNTNSECVSAKLGDRCVQHVCVESQANNKPDAGDETPFDGTCETDKQCGASEETPRCMNGACVTAELADRWMCEQTEVPMDSGTVKYSFHVVDFLTQMAPKSLTVLACRNNDVTCSSPTGTFSDTEATGLVEFDLPKGFLGFFDVQAEGVDKDGDKVTYVPALSYLTKPVVEDMLDRPLQIPTPDLVTALALVEGVQFEPATKGLAMVEAFDCSGAPAGGVRFTEGKGGATPFYLVNHVPNKNANASVYDPVNKVADGGFLNVTPGFVEFSAYWGLDGPMIGSFNAHVRAGTITYLDMYF